MDFQTMGRKVKQKQYKSKKEFKDDLDLIWSNCFVYNATEVRSLYFSLHLRQRLPRTTPSAYAPRASKLKPNTCLSILPTVKSAPILPFLSTSMADALPLVLRPG
jgi:hypothetical protein